MNGFTPNNNTNVIRLLSEAIRKCNKGRNRILMGAVVLCILTLTFVFGTAYGKINAEYTKNIRMDGTTASTYIEEGTKQQYEKVRSLGYVRETGRRMKMGEATESGKKESICSIQVLDQTAWEKMMKPAYTGVHGTYPKKQQEIMLPVKTLKKLGIDNPKRGMKIALDISISFFQTEKEEFKLSGWYSAYTEDNGRSKAIGYVSEKKLKDWGYDIKDGSDILICPSNDMDWKDTEEKLYEDVPMKDNSQQIIATDTAKNRAVKEVTGSYGMAAVEAVVIICGMFLLVYNVMQISMAGDIRQMALLHTIGTTKKQLRKIYIRQIMRTIVPGGIAGIGLSVVLLRYLIPQLLGRQYLNGYGGAEEMQIFRVEILLLAVVFTLLVILGASEQVIWQTVNRTCIEGMHYTEQTGRKKRNRRRTDLGKGTFNKKKRSETQELCFMAWKNVTRYRQRFVITVISMFLGIEMFLIVMVITTGSDYANIINQRPDFLIAGEFSEFAQKEGSGTEYQTQSPDQDPLKSEGDNFELLYDNEYDEFSPISEKVRNRLWNLDGVKKKKSYITEGAYMLSSISRDGLRPLEKDTYLGKNVEYAEESSTDYESGAKMIEGLDADTVQIVSENELKALKTYVEKNKLKVDMDSLENGTGVMIIHDHKLSQKQEKQAEKAVGETVCLSPLKNKEACIRWNSMTDKERDKEDEKIKAETPSTEYTLSGYLDNQADDFPEIHQTWHGAEGDIYYLVSEKGFNRLPTKKKTFCMELNVEKKKEKNIMYEIQKILSAENQRRKSNTQTSLDGEGEAGIFYIARSDLMQKNADYIRGNRIMFGSISVILLCVGLVNYFNITFTGIVGRKKELEIMRKIGMTRRQERKLLLLEGSYYVLLIAGLVALVGTIILKGIDVYMRKQLSYFTFHYPVGAIAGSIVILEILCVIICNLLVLKKIKK
ncbi:ABC transporter permease [Dorea longicatena]|uniref:ABC transporter permease n=1 Tax=Dorea longicatena TaxID=88431 RepID=UPI00156E2183|nr:ABC transporter permease [Dorea longicatena]NSD67574.1 ABC transporter permease [Dorea longicatena]